MKKITKPSKAHPWRAAVQDLPELAKKLRAQRVAEARRRAKQFAVK